ncbi:cold shock domain-containing protein [Streptomyces sp. NPDC002790]|uniref:cold-shock protein n=1 Tax=Streptomyces sp. NPDC002790 TaxID=3154431 RepID=UPI0033333F62
MASGRVVRFDSSRGYGFIAPDGAGEDIFLHVNDLMIPETCLRSGLAVEFEVEDGGRGLKASGVRLAQAAEGAGDDSLCDVLTGAEYTSEITELLLQAGPSLTADQILQLRRELAKFSESHGWIEG